MKRRPRSLLWRLTALAAAVTLGSMLLHLVLMTLWLQPLGETMIGTLAGRVQATREMLLRTPSGEREALAAVLSDAGLQVQRARPHERREAAVHGPAAPLLAARLGPGFRVQRASDDVRPVGPRHLWIGFDAGGEPWEVQMRLEPPVQAVLTTGVGWLALIALAVGGTLMVGLRLVVRPIGEVAERIAAQGPSLQPLPMPAAAGSELRALVAAFNHLVAELQATERTRQQLLAGVSHDLRTPMARLRLRIETQCEPEVAHAAEPELRAVEHIVAQFLAYVQGHGGSDRDSAESLRANVAQGVAGYVEAGQPVALRAGLADASVPALATRRVLTNLIDNALAHGNAPVEVTIEPRQPGQVALTVWDSGAGLSAADFDRALQPFVRLHGDGDIGHCGLGLAIVAQIARQWQGQLRCVRDAAGRFGVELSWPAAQK